MVAVPMTELKLRAERPTPSARVGQVSSVSMVEDPP